MSYIYSSTSGFCLRVICSHCRSAMDYLLGICLDMVLKVRDRYMGYPDAALYGVQKVITRVAFHNTNCYLPFIML